jgi:hypothetical protein
MRPGARWAGGHCFGDSDGGAYRFLDEPKTIRRLIGINARGDILTEDAKLDIAFCVLDREIAGKPERVNTDPSLLRASSRRH